jgi:integrase
VSRVKDLWFSEVPIKDPSGKTVRDASGRRVTEKQKTARHPDRGGNKNAKRWLAVWLDPDGNEVTRAFAKQADAKKHADRMEADADRGEYIDPKAGKGNFGDLARKYLRLRAVGGTTRQKYDSTFRHQVEPAFGHRSVRGIQPSDVLEWLRSPEMTKLSTSVQAAAYLIVAGTLDLAVADKLRRDNPARSPVIKPPKKEDAEREPWTAARVWLVHDEVATPYRPIVSSAAALGLREGEVLALAEEDFDFDERKVHIRRQVLRCGGRLVFKLPKEGRTRTVPLPRGLAAVIQAHVKDYPPKPYELSWMNEDGQLADDPHSCHILFRWHGNDQRTHAKHVTAHQMTDSIWKPALMRAGLIPAPDGKPVPQWFNGDSCGLGMHNLRHFYSTTLQDAGVSPIGVTEFLGHSKKALPVTFRVYGHVTEQTFEQARQAVDSTLFRLRPVESSGTVTELRTAR